MSDIGRYAGSPACPNVVLVVEDGEDDRAKLSSALGQHYRIVFALSVTDGIAAVQRYIPDLILCDLMLPHVDGGRPSPEGGLDFIRRLRSEPRYQHIPAMFITVLEERAYRHKALGLHPDDYIRKSDGYEEIQMRTSNLLINRQLERRVEIDGIVYPKMVLDPLVCNRNIGTVDRLEIVQLEAVLNRMSDKYGREICNPELSIHGLKGAFSRDYKVLGRRLKDLFGLSPTKCLNLFRSEYSKHFLQLGLPVKVALQRSGFRSDDAYRKAFVAAFGMNPTEYVQKHSSN